MNFEIKDLPETIRNLMISFTKIFSGALIISSLYYVFYGNYYSYGEKVFEIFNYVTQDILKIILFLLFSWTSGILCENFVGLIPIGNNKKLLNPYMGMSISKLIRYQKHLFKEENKPILKIYNNLDNSVAIETTIGSASFISGITFGINFLLKLKLIDLIFSIFFIAITILSEISQRSSVKVFYAYNKTAMEYLEKKYKKEGKK